MSSEERKVIEYVSHIPTSVNPYLAVIGLVKGFAKPPSTPDGVAKFSKGLWVVYFIMMLQAFLLLYLGIKRSGSAFGRPRVGKFGLLVFSISDVSAITYSIYSMLMNVYFVMRHTDEHDDRKGPAELLVFGLKFLPMVTCSWVFLWGCACRCAIIFIERSAPDAIGARMKRSIIWGMTGFFAISIFLPYPLVMVAYGAAYEEYRNIFKVIDLIKNSLAARATEYDPKTYNKVSLLMLLLPARHLGPLQDRMETYVDAGIKVYCATVLFPVVAYIPLLAISLRGLYRSSEVQGIRTNQKIRYRRRQLVNHAIALYISTAIHFPTIIWQIFNNSQGFLRDEIWNTVTFIGLHAPFALTGNAVLLILNLHSLNEQNGAKMRPEGALTHNPTDPRPFIDKSNCPILLPRAFSSSKRVYGVDLRRCQSPEKSSDKFSEKFSEKSSVV